MTEHPTDEELLRFVEEADSAGARHVSECPGCAARLQELLNEARTKGSAATEGLARGKSALERGDHRGARRIFEGEIERLESANDLPILGRLHHELALACVGSQDLEAAEQNFAKAAAIFSRLDMPDEHRSSAWGRAQLLLRSDQFIVAISELRSLADDFEDAELLEEAGLCRLDLTEALLAQGEIGQAERAIRAALENFRAIDLDHRATTALSYLYQTLQGGYGSRQAIERVRRFLATIGFGSPVRPAE